MMTKQILRIFGLAALFAMGSVATSAQDFYGQQDRALYAGAYLSISFGAGEKSQKPPLRYGFSAGLRQQNFGINDRLYGHSLLRNDNHLGFAGYGNFDARVLDFSFSDRGFERLSLSSLTLAKKDAFGRVSYLGDPFRLDGDDERDVNKFWLWTGVVVVGAAGLTLLVACATSPCGDMD